MKTINKLRANFQKLLLLFIIFISSTLLNTCKENPGVFTLGEEFIESQTEINLIDTFSVNISTVILDTVVTSGTGNLLIGNYRDDIFGKITSHSYFQIGIPEIFDIENDDTYDSLNLIIRYNKYFFGDTTKDQRILVHQLTESIELNENDIITNKTSIDYNPDLIGSITFTPEPNNTMDTLFIKINDNVGFDLFTKLRDGSEIFSSNESFINYFHGLVLEADSTYEGSVIGFNASEDDVKFILYTTRETSTNEKINHEFKLTDITRQFNNIKHDFTSTQLYTLTEQRKGISNTETSGLSFLQGGIGLVIRIDFPSLQEILLLNRGKVLKAELSISPLSNSYKEFDLPAELVIYETDKLNRRNKQAYYSSSLTMDELYHENTAYLFDVTDYLNDEMSDSYVDPEKGLLITLPYDDLNSRFYRTIIDAQNKNTKLKVYFLTY
jgi:hypothetical protein